MDGYGSGVYGSLRLVGFILKCMSIGLTRVNLFEGSFLVFIRLYYLTRQHFVLEQKSRALV